VLRKSTPRPIGESPWKHGLPEPIAIWIQVIVRYSLKWYISLSTFFQARLFRNAAAVCATLLRWVRSNRLRIWWSGSSPAGRAPAISGRRHGNTASQNPTDERRSQSLRIIKTGLFDLRVWCRQPNYSKTLAKSNKSVVVALRAAYAQLQIRTPEAFVDAATCCSGRRASPALAAMWIHNFRRSMYGVKHS